MRTISTGLLLLAAAVLFACGTGSVPGSQTQAPQSQLPEGPIEPYADPPGYPEDPFESFPDVTGIALPAPEEPVAGEGGSEPLSGVHYSVQIAAVTNRATAERLAESVGDDVPGPVFVEEEQGYWKVRVGALPLMEDAQTLRQTLAEMGFDDAWVTVREP